MGLQKICISRIAGNDYWIICKGSETEVEKLRFLLESDVTFKLVKIRDSSSLRYFEDLRRHLARSLPVFLIFAFAFLMIGASFSLNYGPSYGPKVASAESSVELAYLFLAICVLIQILVHILSRFWVRREDYVLRKI